MIALYSQVKHRAPLEFEIDSNVDAANNDEENINQLNDDDDDGNSNNNTGMVRLTMRFVQILR